ncbi:MAG: MFS transporter [Rubrivivax sp.]|nr:MFS transporter [Rubrivivax sp.]
MPRLLFLFSAVNLVIGTGAFIITGILDLVALDLGLSVAAAGQAMTAYAISTAVLAPLLLMATGAWPRKHVLLLALAFFIAGNAVCALAPNLPVLLTGRVLMGLGASFTPLAAGITVALVAPQRRGQALALVFLGVSLSYVIGLPLGSWLGHAQGWQAAVWAVCGLAVLAAAAVLVGVPATVQAPGAGFSGLGALIKRREVLAVLLLTWLYFTAIFTVFSYIGPVLRALLALNSTQLSWTLMLFGLSGVAGTLIGGAANDRFGARPTLQVQLALLLLMLLLLPLTVGHGGAMLIVLLVWGMAGFGMMAPQQLWLAQLAPAQVPVLLSLNTSMLYLGTAAGAVVGGLGASAVGFAQLPWAGAPFALAGLVLLWASAPPRRAGAAG